MEASVKNSLRDLEEFCKVFARVMPWIQSPSPLRAVACACRASLGEIRQMSLRLTGKPD